MYLISTQGYTNVNVHHLRIRKTCEIWVSMKDIGNCLGVTNIYDELTTKNLFMLKIISLQILLSIVEVKKKRNKSNRWI